MVKIEIFVFLKIIFMCVCVRTCVCLHEFMNTMHVQMSGEDTGHWIPWHWSYVSQCELTEVGART